MEPISVLICALGGEGGGVLSEWLYEAAVLAGHAAQSTSVPGVAQRTGATTYYVEVWPLATGAAEDAGAGTHRPVFSLNPVPGAIDLLVSSELLETVRQVGAGMVSAERTVVVSSTARALTVAEKMQMGDGRSDAAALVATLMKHGRAVELLDLSALAEQAGSAISAVLLGAIAASAVLPFSRAVFEQTIRASGKGVEPSLRGFALAFEAVAARRAQQQVVDEALAPPTAAQTSAPVDLRPLARERLRDYQDNAYVALYDARLGRIEAAEQAVDPQRLHQGAITEEMTRWLALWMAFDDIVQVARLKLRASRSARVRQEVAARQDEVVKLFDHFKPGVAEVAALLPAGLATRLHRWDVGRRARGLEPWALPLRIGTHTVAGALALRVLASLRGQRRLGSRFATEQALIERWLAAVEQGTREAWELGHELAQCGRLIKGYGSTNERGKANLLHVVGHLAQAPSSLQARALAIRAARTAALADEGGLALDQALQAHGAPARPLAAQPIRWYRRRPEAAGK